jgi:hypothetical protein
MTGFPNWDVMRGCAPRLARAVVVAQARKDEKPKEALRGSEDFSQFLRALVDVPDKLSQATNSVASIAVENFRAYDDFYNKFYRFTKKAGYIIPSSASRSHSEQLILIYF